MTEPERCEYCGGPLQEPNHFQTKHHRRVVDPPPPLAQLLHDLHVGCDLDSTGRVGPMDSVRFNHTDDAERLLAAGAHLGDEGLRALRREVDDLPLIDGIPGYYKFADGSPVGDDAIRCSAVLALIDSRLAAIAAQENPEASR